MELRGIQLDETDGDLKVANGGVVVGLTREQIAVEVLLAKRGDFKEWPLLGADAGSLRGGTGGVLWSGRAEEMLAAAGVECESVRVDADGEITMNT